MAICELGSDDEVRMPGKLPLEAADELGRVENELDPWEVELKGVPDDGGDVVEIVKDELADGVVDATEI